MELVKLYESLQKRNDTLTKALECALLNGQDNHASEEKEDKQSHCHSELESEVANVKLQLAEYRSREDHRNLREQRRSLELKKLREENNALRSESSTAAASKNSFTARNVETLNDQ
eukprot:105649_1